MLGADSRPCTTAHFRMQRANMGRRPNKQDGHHHDQRIDSFLARISKSRFPYYGYGSIQTISKTGGLTSQQRLETDVQVLTHNHSCRYPKNPWLFTKPWPSTQHSAGYGRRVPIAGERHTGGASLVCWLVNWLGTLW